MGNVAAEGLIGEGVLRRHAQSMVQLAREARMHMRPGSQAEVLQSENAKLLMRKGGICDASKMETVAVLLSLVMPPGDEDGCAERWAEAWMANWRAGPAWDLCMLEAAETLLCTHSTTSPSPSSSPPVGGARGKGKLLDAVQRAWTSWLRLPGGVPLWETGGSISADVAQVDQQRGSVSSTSRNGRGGGSERRGLMRCVNGPALPAQCGHLISAMAVGRREGGVDETDLDLGKGGDVGREVGRRSGRVMGMLWRWGGRDARDDVAEMVASTLMQVSMWMLPPQGSSAWTKVAGGYISEFGKAMGEGGRGNGERDGEGQVGYELMDALRVCAEGMMRGAGADVFSACAAM